MQASQADAITDAVADGVLAADPAGPSCRFCGGALRHTFVDLGMSPLCESYVPADRERDGAVLSATRQGVRSCFLVQLEDYVTPDTIFSEYAYFSSYSDSWVEHARTLRRDGHRAIRP